MQNLAGNPVSIFLFRFVLRNNKNVISFVLNESIAEDMYPEIDEQLEPLIQACAETLLRYKHNVTGDVIMDGSILVDNCFEVMLVKGLGAFFIEHEKQNLFNDAHEIAKLLIEVMDKRSKEIEQGVYPGPQPVVNKIQRSGLTEKALGSLAHQRKKIESFHCSSAIRPDLKRLVPDDLPIGVAAKKGYDHRGYCIAFEHETLGDLGKMTLVKITEQKMLMEVELSTQNPELMDKKKDILNEITSTIKDSLDQIQ